MYRILLFALFLIAYADDDLMFSIMFYSHDANKQTAYVYDELVFPVVNKTGLMVSYHSLINRYVFVGLETEWMSDSYLGRSTFDFDIVDVSNVFISSLAGLRYPCGDFEVKLWHGLTYNMYTSSNDNIFPSFYYFDISWGSLFAYRPFDSKYSFYWGYRMTPGYYDYTTWSRYYWYYHIEFPNRKSIDRDDYIEFPNRKSIYIGFSIDFT